MPNQTSYRSARLAEVIYNPSRLCKMVQCMYISLHFWHKNNAILRPYCGPGDGCRPYWRVQLRQWFTADICTSATSPFTHALYTTFQQTHNSVAISYHTSLMSTCSQTHICYSTLHTIDMILQSWLNEHESKSPFPA